MKKIVQITKVLMTLRADPELEIAGTTFAAAPRVVRETSIPRAFLLADVREKRTFRRLARKLAWFIALLVFYSSALVLDRNITTRYALGQTLTKELITTSLAPSGVTFASGIDDIASFWDWLSNALVPKVYATTTSTGLPRRPDQLYMIGTRSKILGGFHIIQQRYLAINTSSPEHKNNMCYSTINAGKNLICYSTSGVSTDAFGSLVSAGSSANETELQSLKMFQYTVNEEGVGGFQTYFLRSTTAGAAELARIERMRAYGWFDEQTQRIQITLPFYNIHLKMAGAVRMYVDSDLTGAITTSSTIHVMNTESYNLDVTDNFIRFIYEIIYAVSVLSFAGSELWGMLMLAHGDLRKYVARHGWFETLSEVVSIGTNVTVVVSRCVIMTSPKRTLINTASSFEYYAPLTAFTDEDDIFIGLNMLNVMVLTMRVLKFFKVTNGGQRLLNSITSAMPDIVSFLPIYVTVIIAYAFGGHLLFGLTFAEWSTYSRALCRVVEMNFGLYDPGPIYDAGGPLGFVYTASASVIFCIIMLNVFMAIVMSTWDAFTEKEVEKAKIRERYREEMCFSDLLGLVLLREGVLDSLIAVLLRMDEHETITKALLKQHWHADNTRIPKWVRRRVLKWYWNSDDTAHVGPNAQHVGNGDAHNDAKLSSTGPAPDPSELLHPRSNHAETPLQHNSKRSIVRVTPTRDLDNGASRPS